MRTSSLAASQKNTIHASFSDYLNDHDFFQQVLDLLITSDGLPHDDNTEFSFVTPAPMSTVSKNK